MKIAMVSEHASPLAVLGGVDAGGQNVHVAALAAALAERGHEVVVHTRRDDPDLPRQVAMSPGVTVDHLDAGPPAPIPKDEIYPHVGAMAGELERRWSADRPDVVHSHFWMSGLAALRAAEAVSVPVVHTYHALGAVKRRHQGPTDTSPPERVGAEADIAARASRIVATCTDELFELVRLGADPGRITVVPCGVDTELFTPVGPSSPRRSGCPRLVSVGRLVERKGVADVIRAMPRLPGCELLVAGGPPGEALDTDPEARRLRRLAAQMEVGDRVRLVGRLTREEVPALIRSADLVVCAPWYEPFGIVPLEAMACAVPVVATAVGGLTDTVVDGVTGGHVAPGDPDAIAAAVARLLEQPDRRRSMGDAGRRRVVERYRWARVAESTTAAYRQVAAETRGATRRRRRPSGTAHRQEVAFG